MGKKTVFNRIVLRTLRWIVRNAIRNFNPVNQSLQVFLENNEKNGKLFIGCP